MKEKDIVDFDKMEKTEDDDYIDPDTGEEVGCEICYVHKKAGEVFRKKQFGHPKSRVFYNDDFRPLCPTCGEPLNPCGTNGYCYSVVSEANFHVPEGEVSLCEIWKCLNDKCSAENFAMMPIPVAWNANHDIMYTGGRQYAETEDVEKLIKDIFEKIGPSIVQYVSRKTNPQNDFDKMLELWNVETWCRNDVEHAVCNWLYEHGLKK